MCIKNKKEMQSDQLTYFFNFQLVFERTPPNKHRWNNTASGAIETEFAMVESWDRTKNKHRINTEWTKNKQRINKE